MVDRDPSFRNWSVYQNWNPRWKGWVNKLLSQLRGGICTNRSEISITLERQTGSKQHSSLWISVTGPNTKHVTVGPATFWRADSELPQKFNHEVTGKQSMSLDMRKVVICQSVATLSLVRSKTSWKHPRKVSRCYRQNDSKYPGSATHDRKIFHWCVRWIWFPVSDDKSFGFAWRCDRHEIWSQEWRDEAILLSPEFDNLSSLQNVFQEWFRLHDNTFRALPNLFLPVLPSSACSVPACHEHPFNLWPHGLGTGRCLSL